MDAASASLQPILILRATAVLAMIACRFLSLPLEIGLEKIGVPASFAAAETRLLQR
jgi:hypothetical protein